MRPATSLPWDYYAPGIDCFVITLAPREQEADIVAAHVTKQDAEYIVNCCNNYQELVLRLQNLIVAAAAEHYSDDLYTEIQLAKDQLAMCGEDIPNV